MYALTKLLSIFKSKIIKATGNAICLIVNKAISEFHRLSCPCSIYDQNHTNAIEFFVLADVEQASLGLYK